MQQHDLSEAYLFGRPAVCLIRQPRPLPLGLLRLPLVELSEPLIRVRRSEGLLQQRRRSVSKKDIALIVYLQCPADGFAWLCVKAQQTLVQRVTDWLLLYRDSLFKKHDAI